MAYKTIQCVAVPYSGSRGPWPDLPRPSGEISVLLVPNLKLFGSIKSELWAKEVGEYFIMLYGKMGLGSSFAHQHGSVCPCTRKRSQTAGFCKHNKTLNW